MVAGGSVEVGPADGAAEPPAEEDGAAAGSEGGDEDGGVNRTDGSDLVTPRTDTAGHEGVGALVDEGDP